jgi:hypothetical protein
VRPCPLYKTLGVDRFIEQVKSAAFRQGLEAHRDRLQDASGRRLEDLPVSVSSLGEVTRTTSVSELEAAAASFPKNGIPECVPCPLSGGHGLGCYRYVRYPVDETFERELFAYLLAMLGRDVAGYVAASDAAGRDLTAGRLVYEMVMTEIGDETPFRTARGPRGTLAMLEAPLTALLDDGTRISSATLLQAAFHPIDSGLTLQLYAMFYRDFYRWLESRGVDATTSATLAEVRHAADLLIAAARMVQASEEAQVVVRG